MANRYADLERWLRESSRDRQTRLAIRLARLLEPLAAVSTSGQPAGGLAPVAEAIRTARGPADLVAPRAALESMPELAAHDEPDGLAWYAFRASVAWIYAADALGGAPEDGVVNVFKTALDVLDVVDDELGDTDFVDQLMTAVTSGDDSMNKLASDLRRIVAGLHGV
jgi:hypothetical protein